MYYLSQEYSKGNIKLYTGSALPFFGNLPIIIPKPCILTTFHHLVIHRRAWCVSVVIVIGFLENLIHIWHSTVLYILERVCIILLIKLWICSNIQPSNFSPINVYKYSWWIMATIQWILVWILTLKTDKSYLSLTDQSDFR